MLLLLPVLLHLRKGLAPIFSFGQ